ncbi:hypothetical protein [Nakamurella lactea]|uniref:hypothetical protein n=1 Tax=Nakamurella lactea TaxID=459515 RepID=UPI00048AA4EB|nr:hypothetical protein [Nakamurella lactea]
MSDLMNFIPTVPVGSGVSVDVILEIRRVTFLEAAALLDTEAPEHFGSYWGWRAAADRLRLAAEED